MVIIFIHGLVLCAALIPIARNTARVCGDSEHGGRVQCLASHVASGWSHDGCSQSWGLPTVGTRCAVTKIRCSVHSPIKHIHLWLP